MARCARRLCRISAESVTNRTAPATYLLDDGDRRDLRRGDFASQQILRAKIEQFIDYFNATMAKPFRWTYAGKPLAGAA